MRSLSEHRFYVYILYREDGITPFYVGKGTGNRWLDHLRNPKRGKGRHKDSIIVNMLERGIDVPKRKIAENLTAAEALNLEIATIQRIGREPHGPLVNKTRGGDGLVDPSDDVRVRMGTSQKGRIHPPEVRAQMSLSHIGKKDSPDTIEKKRLAGIGRKHTDEAKAQIGTARAGRRHSEAAKAKMSIAGKGRKRPPMSPETKRKISIALTNLDPDIRARLTAETTARGVSPETRAKISRAKLGTPLSDDHKAKLSAVRKGKKKSDQTRMRMSESAKQRSPEHLEKIAATKRGIPRSEETKRKISATRIANNLARKLLPVVA